MLHPGPRARLEVRSARDGPAGDLARPERRRRRLARRAVAGRDCLTPDEASYYLYFVLPPEPARARATGGPVRGDRVLRGPLRAVPRAVRVDRPRGRGARGSTRRPSSAGTATPWACSRFRRALFPLPDFDATRTQNQDASFRVEFRQEVLIARVQRDAASRPTDAAALRPRWRPLPELKKLPGPLLPDQLPVHRDHERLQLQVHLVPGRHHGPPARLHEEGEGRSACWTRSRPSAPGWGRSTR